MKSVLWVLLCGTFCAPGQAPDMVLIPAGEFQMASDNGERDERPVHGVIQSMSVRQITTKTQNLARLMNGQPLSEPTPLMAMACTIWLGT